jgi:cytochrome P450
MARTDFDLLGAARKDDPHPIYHALRAEEPVHWSDQLRGWVLTRYADCVHLLRSPDFSADRVTPFLRELPPATRTRLEPLAKFLKPWILVLDPPDHTRIRGLMNRAFSAKAVEALRPRIGKLVDEFLAARTDDHSMDLIAELAYPLPATVIADMLGVPAADRDRFKAWSDDVAAFVGSFSLDPAVLERVLVSVGHLDRYFRERIAERRKRPAEDLLSVLIAGSDGGARLNDEELVANCAFLLFAGHETTTNLIGNGLLWLLRNPEAYARLRAQPALVPNAVEEILRYDPPIDRISRIAKVETRIAGQPIRAGERVIALTAAANRDPEQFHEPDRFDVARAENRHLGFGLGAHFCIGGPLARVEGQEVLARMLLRFRDLSLEPHPLEWADTLGFRGVHKLRLRLQA